MKFIPCGAVRIDSDPSTQALRHVAFRKPSGECVLVLGNTTGEATPITVQAGSHSFTAALPAKSVFTCVWQPD
jgi:O-glycosyl hydrolase